jgi:FkbM family methyltransferase
MNYFSSIADINKVSRKEFEDLCVANVDHIYLGDDVVLCKVLTKYKLYVNSKDRVISPHMILDGFWEAWITRLLADIVKPGFFCLDIGANVGYYSLLMSELCGHDGKTIAIEPNPKICELLRYTEANHGWNFPIVEGALADKAGKATLTIPDMSHGGATIKPNDLIPGRSQIEVQTWSVDELVKQFNLPRVDVIKMDVEGVEPLVFSGMQQTIAANPGIQIILEYSPSIYHEAVPFTDYLFSNFSVFEIEDAKKIKKIEPSARMKMAEMQGHTDLYLRRK